MTFNGHKQKNSQCKNDRCGSKNTHKPRYCEKEKDKPNKRILRSLSFEDQYKYD
jgi:hypothetical protein